LTPLLYPIALLQFSSIQHSFLPKTGSVPGHVKLLGLDAPIKTELPPNVPPETEEHAPAPAPPKSVDKVRRRSQGFSEPRPRVIILGLKEVLSYDPYSGEFTWKNMQRRCKSARRFRRRGANSELSLLKRILCLSAILSHGPVEYSQVRDSLDVARYCATLPLARLS
jgi:hypothetical protein